jgi:hypothetical protein
MNSAWRFRRLMLACPRRSCHAGLVAIDEPGRAMTGRPAMLLRRGRIPEGITLGWNVAAIVVLAAAAGWRQADPVAALVIVFYALREAREIFLAGTDRLRVVSRVPHGWSRRS